MARKPLSHNVGKEIVATSHGGKWRSSSKIAETVGLKEGDIHHVMATLCGAGRTARGLRRSASARKSTIEFLSRTKRSALTN